MKIPELLAPAGSREKLKYALHYGADSVYCSGKQYGLRSSADNFTPEDLIWASDYVHDRGKRIYVTLNASLRDEDFKDLKNYIRFLDEIGIDHVIVADPGVFLTVRETAPEMKISMSTQSNILNSENIRFWYQNGARRIVLARELGINQIREIIKNKPEDLEIETFVHGAMCISHSGRCLLSNYMTGRDANKGECAQPCRWRYELVDRYAVVEKTRPDEAYDIREDQYGSYIFNSKDLCLIDQVPELIEAGVDSFKIEGRMKSLYYVSSVVSAYRQKIDDFAAQRLRDEDYYRKELEKVSHRAYTTAFYHGKTDDTDQNYSQNSYIRDYEFVGVVEDYDEESGTALIEQRNKIFSGDELEVLHAGSDQFSIIESADITDTEGNPIESTPQAKMLYKIKSPPVRKRDILRKKVVENNTEV